MIELFIVVLLHVNPSNPPDPITQLNYYSSTINGACERWTKDGGTVFRVVFSDYAPEIDRVTCKWSAATQAHWTAEIKNKLRMESNSEFNTVITTEAHGLR